jgi:hypothetical protein
MRINVRSTLLSLFAIIAARLYECEGFSRVVISGRHLQMNKAVLMRGVSTDRREVQSTQSGFALMAGEGDEFWTQQKALMEEMTGKAEKSLRDEEREKFASRRTGLVADTALFTALIFCLLWAVAANPFVSFSYAFGSIFGIAYSYGLGKYVETIGGSIDDTETLQGAGVGQARFAFLIMLFIFVGRFKTFGLLEIPTISGFFTYQLASLSQGLKEIND